MSEYGIVAGSVMNSLVTSWRDAVDRLEEVLKQPYSTVVRDSAIKRFELAFELSWKALQRALEREGVIVRSPREALRAGFKLGWLADDRWMAMLEDRNLSVHTYDERTAQMIYERLNDYLKLMRDLVEQIEKQDESGHER